MQEIEGDLMRFEKRLTPNPEKLNRAIKGAATGIQHITIKNPNAMHYMAAGPYRTC